MLMTTTRKLAHNENLRALLIITLRAAQERENHLPLSPAIRFHFPYNTYKLRLLVRSVRLFGLWTLRLSEPHTEHALHV